MSTLIRTVAPEVMKVVAMNGFGPVDTFALEERNTPTPNFGEIRIQISNVKS